MSPTLVKTNYLDIQFLQKNIHHMRSLLIMCYEMPSFGHIWCVESIF